MTHSPDAAVRCSHVVFDLSGVTFCDSTGLNMFIRFRNIALARSGDLTLVNTPPRIHQLLAIPGLSEAFRYEDLGSVPRPA